MANVPARMPQGLVSRDATKRQAVQVGQAVRAIGVAELELACAHLAGGRPLSAPASLQYELISTSGATLRTRIAAPIVPEWAIVIATLSATDARTCTVRASSDTTGLTTWTEVGPVQLGGDAPVPVPVVIEVGGGTIEAPAYEEIHLDITDVSAGASVIRLESWQVVLLPFVPPYSSGQL